MTVVTPISNPLSRALILAIFTSCGRCRFLDEKYFDACTAVAGSGPAFVALVLEAMADGGVMMGLPRAEALELAAQSESRGDTGRSTSCVPGVLVNFVGSGFGVEGQEARDSRRLQHRTQLTISYPRHRKDGALRRTSPGSTEGFRY